MTRAETDVERSGRAPSEGSVRLRVRYCECDPMGVAHHASYVAWLEMGRTELLRDSRMTYAHLEEEGVFLVVTKVELRYRRPIRYDDVVEVRTRVASASRVKIRHEYEVVLVERGDRDGTRPLPVGGVLAAASSELACVDCDGKPQALPGWLSGRGA